VPGINEDSILTLAERSARRAIAIAPRLGEAYISLGEILDHQNKWEEAGEAFKQGIAQSPRYATGHQWYSHHLMILNRWDDAIREMERAKELDPLSLVIIVALAGAYDGGDRAADATPLYQQAQALYPEHPYTLLLLFAHDLVLGRIEPALSDYRRYLVASGTDSGRAADIERRLRDPALRPAAVRQIAEGPHPGQGVILHRVLDGDDATIAYLAGLVGSPGRGAINKSHLAGFLGPRLRANPRMQAVLVQLGFPPPRGEGERR
jgi:tetratricopeptide (TPR) repeat protein